MVYKRTGHPCLGDLVWVLPPGISGKGDPQRAGQQPLLPGSWEGAARVFPPGREILVTCVGGGRSRELERFLFGGLARPVGCGHPRERTWALLSGTCSSPASWASRAVLF